MKKETLEMLAVAYTAKTSSASTPKQFLEDYNANLKMLEKESKEQSKKEWMY